MKTRSGRRFISSAVVAILVATLAVACRGSASRTFSASVTPAGGTVQLGNVTVTVPEGAVTADTQLTATEPTALPATEAPLGLRSVVFDLSFADGSQPLVPLEVTITLADRFLPEGMDPANALLYTETGNGWVLVPNEVAGTTLAASLTHLSRKAVSFLTKQDVERILRDDVPGHSTCEPNQEINGVKIAADDSDGRVKACLVNRDGHTSLMVANNTNYIWPVVASSGLGVREPSRSINETGILTYSNWISAGNNRIHLTKGSYLEALLDPNRLPATLTLEANASTWIAEVFWSGTKLAVEIASGRSGDEFWRTVQFVMNDMADLQECVALASHEVQGANLVGKAVEAIDKFFNHCGDLVSNLVSKVVDLVGGGSLFGRFFRRLMAFVNGAIDGVRAVYGGAISVTQMIRGNITIRVEAANLRPPATSADLVSFVQAGRAAAISDYDEGAWSDADDWYPLFNSVAFTTPSGNIACEIDNVEITDLNQVICRIKKYSFPPPPPRDCRTITYLNDHVLLSRGGDFAHGLCTGGVLLHYKSNVLPYGYTLTNGAIACRSESAFLACVDLTSRHGFVLSRELLRVYDGTN